MNHVLLIIGIISAILSLFIGIKDDKSNLNKNILIRILIATSILLIGKEIIGYLISEQDRISEELRDEILSEVRRKVVRIDDFVSNLDESQLLSLINEVAIFPENKYNFFDKEDPVYYKSGHWDWSRIIGEIENSNNNSIKIGLAMQFDTSHMYRIDWILKYLYSNLESAKSLKQKSEWYGYDLLDSTYIKEFLSEGSYFDYVFFINKEGEIIGYSNAEEFTAELYIYKVNGLSGKISNLFNQPHMRINEIKEKFSSIKDRVIISESGANKKDLRKILDIMISKDWNEGFLIEKNDNSNRKKYKFYHIDVARLITLSK